MGLPIGLPGYYAETAPSGLTPLPVSWDPSSNPYSVTREQILLETGRGITFEYEWFTRRTPEFEFTVAASQLAEFHAMHDAVVGGAFYFIPDINASPLDLMHVRKEPSFLPEPIGVFLLNGQPEQFFKYTLKLREEITAADIED